LYKRVSRDNSREVDFDLRDGDKDKYEEYQLISVTNNNNSNNNNNPDTLPQ